MSDNSNGSFDRMRGMLMRAAEIRDSEQQQIFDSLDEIHARLAALDAIGTVRKKLTDLPDRSELNALAERIDETATKLDNQEVMLGAITRAIESLPDKLAKPIAQLDGRLDALTGRMEGVSGRMDGLDDRLGGLHKRLDDVDNRFDRHEMRLDALPNTVSAPIKERVDAIEKGVAERVDGAVHALEETGEGLRNLLGDTSVGLHRRLEELAQRPDAVDPTAAFDGVTERLDTLAGRLEEIGTRLEAVENGVGGRFEGFADAVEAKLDAITTAVDEKLGALDTTVQSRPDTDAVSGLIEKSNAESERRNANQLDEAMATFAELILGRSGQYAQQQPPPPPRPAQRRSSRSKAAVKSHSQNGASAEDLVGDDPDE
ncbi:PA containing protein [Pseudonocardia phyllosphaerae]|uniref:PA containing protein n=1 Tax=Pseudonocardia phyllosphaerae TaxID=3390502 RepID=UPI00397AEE3C